MNSIMKKAGRHADLLAAGAVVLVVVMMVIPLPPFLLDLAITLNISSALMIVVATLYVPRALDFSAFPSLLLLTTIISADEMFMVIARSSRNAGSGITIITTTSTTAPAASRSAWRPALFIRVFMRQLPRFAGDRLRLVSR